MKKDTHSWKDNKTKICGPIPLMNIDANLLNKIKLTMWIHSQNRTLPIYHEFNVDSAYESINIITSINRFENKFTWLFHKFKKMLWQHSTWFYDKSSRESRTGGNLLEQNRGFIK